jgi:hypothetical protein
VVASNQILPQKTVFETEAANVNKSLNRKAVFLIFGKKGLAMLESV